MANQIRAGGLQKLVTPLVDEGLIRRAQSGIQDIFDLEYVTRLFKDASIPDEKLVSGGGGDNALFVSAQSLNPTSPMVVVGIIVAHGVRTDVPFSAFTPDIPAEARVLSIGLTLYPEFAGEVSAYIQTGASVGHRVPIIGGVNEAIGRPLSGTMVVETYPAGTIGITVFFANPLETNVAEMYLIGYWR